MAAVTFEPILAKTLGSETEAILINVMEWLQEHSYYQKDFCGQSWVFVKGTYWYERLCHLSKRTIQGALKKLRESGILLVQKVGKATYYRLNHLLLSQRFPFLFTKNTSGNPANNNAKSARQEMQNLREQSANSAQDSANSALRFNNVFNNTKNTKANNSLKEKIPKPEKSFDNAQPPNVMREDPPVQIPDFSKPEKLTPHPGGAMHPKSEDQIKKSFLNRASYAGLPLSEQLAGVLAKLPSFDQEQCYVTADIISRRYLCERGRQDLEALQKALERIGEEGFLEIAKIKISQQREVGLGFLIRGLEMEISTPKNANEILEVKKAKSLVALVQGKGVFNPKDYAKVS